MMGEEWKEVYGFDILFEISNKGRVRTKHHGKQGYKKEYRYIEPTDNGNGYLRMNVRQNNHPKTIYIHRLVADAFVENPNKYCEVNHKDENKHNNVAENLEWCLHRYNCNYGTRNEKCGGKKQIRCKETGIIYESVKHASDVFNVGKTALSNCLKGRSKTCAGYSWEYVS